MNILLYADIPGLPEYVLLTRKAVTVPAIGDRLRINADLQVFPASAGRTARLPLL